MVLRKICIVTDKHISSNPRVWKEAHTLVNDGYNVTIVTIFNSLLYKENDADILKKFNGKLSYIAAINTIPGEGSFARRLLYKLRTIFVTILKKFNYDSIYLLSKDPVSVYKTALKQNADLYIAHIDCSLYVGKRLIQDGKNVAFDFEDWYSHDYLVDIRPVKLLKKLEGFALDNGRYITCPSLAMAKALFKVYSPKQMPSVIYNGFPVEKNSVATNPYEMTTVVWFSQTIGRGRGLEKLISALHHLVSPARLLLIGTCSIDYKQVLESLFPQTQGHVLEFIPFVKHDQLHDILLKCHIGIATEQKIPESRNKTITNKILQYLQAGLKVFATNTDGQAEVYEQFKDAIVMVNNDDNTENWAFALQTLVNIKMDRNSIINRHNEIFSWNAQEGKLLQLVNNALV